MLPTLISLMRRLLESEDIDSPEMFNVKANLLSPVAQIASKNGFVRSDQHGHQRWIKHLSDGSMAALTCVTYGTDQQASDQGAPYDTTTYKAGTGGPHWQFSRTPPLAGHAEVLAQAPEQSMVYLLQAILQRLATWPRWVPKPKI